MGKIAKLTQSVGGSNTTAYPITIPQAVVDPTSKATLREELDNLSKGTGLPMAETVAELEALNLPVGQIGLISSPNSKYSGGIGILGMAKWDGLGVTDTNGALAVEQSHEASLDIGATGTVTLTFANAEQSKHVFVIDFTNGTATWSLWSGSMLIDEMPAVDADVWVTPMPIGYWLVSASDGTTTITADNWDDTSADTINGWLHGVITVSGGAEGTANLYQIKENGAELFPVSALLNDAEYSSDTIFVFDQFFDGMNMSAEVWQKLMKATAIIVNGAIAQPQPQSDVIINFYVRMMLPDDSFSWLERLSYGEYSLIYNPEGQTVSISYYKTFPELMLSDLAKETEIVNVTTTSAILSPNKFYIWESVMSSVSVTLLEDSTTLGGKLQEFMFQFTASTSGCTLSVPSGIKWLNGETPVIEGGKTYQVSIVNNLAVCCVFE